MKKSTKLLTFAVSFMAVSVCYLSNDNLLFGGVFGLLSFVGILGYNKEENQRENEKNVSKNI